MGFGYNRYAMVLALCALTATGCSEDKKRNNFSSTTAAATSGTTAGTTSGSTTATGQGPELAQAVFNDADGDKMLSRGDKILLTFSDAVEPIPAGTDPSAEFQLSVAQDNLGKGATVTNGVNPNTVEIILGDQPSLHVSETFDIAKTIPGSASGINVSLTASGQIKGKDSGTVRAAPAPLDIDGKLQSGFLPAGSMNFARGGHAAVTLDDGRVLIVGGVSAKGTGGYITEAELYDPMTQSFTVVSDLSGDAGRMMRGKIPVRMINGTAVKLTDGTVLISGGFGVEKKGWFGFGKDKVDTLESAFIFDPTANSFSRVGDMKASRHSHSATLMADGRVLIVGGYNDSFWSKHKTQAPFEIYDPAKKEFAKVGGFLGFFSQKTKDGRMNHSATSIEGGTGVLLTGGNRYEGGYLFGLIKPKLKMNSSTEVIRDGNKAERAGDLTTARMHHAAAAVNARNVLVAGGHDPSTVLNGLELYDAATGTWSAVGNLAGPRTNAAIAMEGTKALIIGGTTGNSEIATVEVFDADAKAMSQTTYKLATGRNGHTVSTLKDGRILVIGGFTGATALDGLDGAPLASAEVFVRQ